MRNMLLIAKREYLEQVRGRAFRMTTIGLPGGVCADYRGWLFVEPGPGRESAHGGGSLRRSAGQSNPQSTCR